jgi:hypothetical protein
VEVAAWRLSRPTLGTSADKASKEEIGGKGKILELEDARGEKIQGRDGVVQLTDEWRVAGA